MAKAKTGDRIKVYDKAAAALSRIIGQEYDGEFGTVTSVEGDGLLVHWDDTDTTAPWFDEYEVLSNG